MGKQRNEVEEVSSVEDQAELEESDAGSEDSDKNIVERELNEQEDLEEKFGQKAINDEAGMLRRLQEIQLNFYNRLESKKLIKKQGKVPFTEHMTISEYTFNSFINLLPFAVLRWR